MFSVLLIRLTLAESIPVDQEKYKELTRPGSELPIALDFFNPFCGHCRAFAPTWHQLANASHFDGRVVFGHVNCLTNTALCRPFDHFGYPAILFIDVRRNATVHFEGAPTFTALEQFLEKQLAGPLRIVETDAELDAAKRTANVSSLFVLFFQDALDERVFLFRRVAHHIRARTGVFVARAGLALKLEVFRSPLSSLLYDGNWTLESLLDFVEANSEVLLPPLGTHIAGLSGGNPDYFFIVFLLPEMYASAASVVGHVKSPYRFFYDVFTDDSPTARQFGVQRQNLPQFVIVDTAVPKYAIVEARTSADLQRWIDGVDLGAIRWSFSAPGLGGILAFLRELAVLAPLAVVAAAVLCWRLLSRNRRRCSVKKSRTGSRGSYCSDLGVDVDDDDDDDAQPW
jgi:thiol-disulfide isomerase/thioredoxin